MKTVVSLQELVDAEIRPDALSAEFHALTRTSVAALVMGPLVDVSCQACGGNASRPAFEKVGLTYRQCRTCDSLFVSPRPSPAALADYHATSPAAVFWRERILGTTLATRRAKLARPRAEWVADGLAEHRPQAVSGIDVSPQGAQMVDELSELMPAIDPMKSLPGHEVPGAAGSADFVTAFDALDRVADAPAFVAGARAVLRPGGLFFVTAPTISGFDLQVLWERSPTIVPPDKLNVLSVRGFKSLFSAGWTIIEFSTPGMFDVENVRRAVLTQPTADWPRAIRELVGQDSEHARLEFQEYLQRHRLASFARLIVRRD